MSSQILLRIHALSIFYKDFMTLRRRPVLWEEEHCTLPSDELSTRSTLIQRCSREEQGIFTLTKLISLIRHQDQEWLKALQYGHLS